MTTIRHSRLRVRLGRTARYLGVGLLLLYIGFPLYWTAISSVKNPFNFYEVQYWPEAPSLLAYRLVLADALFRQAIFNSLLVTFSVLLLTLVVGALAGYAIGRLRFRGSSALRITVLALFVIPQVGLIPGLFQLVRSPCVMVGGDCPQFSLYNTLWALLGTYPILTLPLVILFAAAYYRDLPADVEEAAQVDGATLFQSFVYLTLPLSVPALITTGLLTFITSWNEYLFPVTFTQLGPTRTAPVQLAQIGFTGFGTIMSLAGAVVLMAPVVILVLSFGPQITSGLTTFAGVAPHSETPVAVRQTRWAEIAAPERTLLAVLALGALAFAVAGWRAVAFPGTLDYGEGPLLAQTAQLAAGQNIYRADLSSAPFTIANYPPVYTLTLAPFARLFGPAFWYGRLLSVLSSAAAAGFVGLLVAKLTRDRFAAWLAGLMLLAVPYVSYWAGLYRIDCLALALSLAGLYVVVRYSERRWGIPLAALLLLAAIFTRQSYGLAAPLAACAWLAWPHPRRALLLAALIGAAGLALLATINTLTGGGFWFNIVTANINEFQTARLLEYASELWTLMPIAIIAAGVFVLGGWRRPGWRLIAAYAFGAALSGLTVGKVGSNANYLLELSAALCLALGALLAWLRSVPLARQLVAALLAVQFVLLVPGTRYQLFTEFRLGGGGDAYAIQRLVARTSGPILADEDMGALALAGKPLLFQPFELTQLANAGLWQQQPLLAAIERRDYALILIYKVEGIELEKERWTPEMLAAIQRAYRETQRIGNTVVLRPRL